MVSDIIYTIETSDLDLPRSSFIIRIRKSYNTKYRIQDEAVKFKVQFKILYNNLKHSLGNTL
jgi:hypothetical protein